MYDTNPTPRQKKAFKIWQSFVNNPDKKKWTWYEVLRKAGYAESTANEVSPVKKSKGWKQLLSRVDEAGILDNVEGIALNQDDKRVAINAAKEIFKLKGRYPKKGVKVDFGRERKEIMEEEEKKEAKEAVKKIEQELSTNDEDK